MLKEIEYLDATPAAGKTREARRLMSQHIASGDTKMFVYAAPTHSLLFEVERSLRDNALIDNDDYTIFRICGGKSPVTQYAFLMGLADNETAARLIEPEVYAALVQAKLVCRVVLCTHECLVKAPKTESKQTTRATVVFDEARNCVLSDLEVQVSQRTLTTITEVFGLRNFSEDRDVTFGGNEYRSKLTTLDASGFPNSSTLLKGFGVTALTDLPKSVIDLYRMKAICKGGRADVLVEILLPKTKDSKQKALIVGLSRPSSIFEGYGRIIIMSAYFRYSQMYHMLMQAHVGHQKGGPEFELVEYRSGSLDFAEKSRRMTETALEKIRVGALLTGTQSGKLTSTFLSSGLVVTPELQNALIAKCKLKKAEVIKYAFDRKRIPGLTKQENESLWGCANPPLLSLSKIASDILVGFKVKEALCFTNAYGSNSGGAKFFVDKVKVMNVVDFMVNVPISTGGAQYESERKYVTKEMIEHLNFVTAKKLFTIPKSTSVLGLNSYSHLNAFVHLAALNPKPAVARILKRVLPLYDPDVDYAISNIIQTMYRTSLRNPSSEETVHCLVLTDWIISKIEEVCFSGRTMKRMRGYRPKFTELNYIYQDIEKKRTSGALGGTGKSVDVPDDVKYEIQKLQTRASVVSRQVLERKARALRIISENYPNAKRNIDKWLAKWGLQEKT
jgi:hypothetical protein